MAGGGARLWEGNSMGPLHQVNQPYETHWGGSIFSSTPQKPLGKPLDRKMNFFSAHFSDLVDTNNQCFPTKDKDTTGSTKSSFIWHTVRGKKVLGLLIDPGASRGILGSDTFGEILREVLQKHGIVPEFTDTIHTYTGIEGNNTSGVQNVKFSFPIEGMEGSFEGDALGGTSTWCPPLVPNPKLIKMRCGVLCGYFENGDGLLLFQNAVPLMGYRLLLTDSDHYLLPIDGLRGCW